MDKFLLRFFAAIGFVVVLLATLIVYGFLHASQTHTAIAQAPKEMILTIDFTRPIVAVPPQSSLSAVMNYDEGSQSIYSLLKALKEAQTDPRVKAVVARFGTQEPSFALAQEIRDALVDFRKSGKPTYAFAPSYGSFGMGNKSYYLASVMEEIWLQPVGTVGLTGIGAEAPFGKTALETLGVKAEFLQREEYKSAMESFSRDAFSPAAREDMAALLGNLSEQQIRGLSENRKWEPEKTKTIIAQGPYTAEEALQNRIVSHIGYEDELDKTIKAVVGDKAEAIGPDEYVSFFKGKEPKATVALISAVGMISDSAGGNDMLSGESGVDANEIAGAFKDASDDENVKAILFRIDSPGGSPTASETIRRALVKAKEAGKPVIVSMGEVAASGGYWVAMDANKIVAAPSTITGSIGVIGGKFVVGDLWKKLGVNWESLSTSGNATMWSMQSSFDAFGTARVNALLDETYKAFVTNVSVARHIPLDKMATLAKGRVYTGEQAQKVGLVDTLGGVSVAIREVKKAISLAEDDTIALQSFPPPMTPFEQILKFFQALNGESVSVRRLSSVAQGIQAKIAASLGGFATCSSFCVRAEVPPAVAALAQ